MLSGVSRAFTLNSIRFDVACGAKVISVDSMNIWVSGIYDCSHSVLTSALKGSEWSDLRSARSYCGIHLL
jgi:hypothetical protein